MKDAIDVTLKDNAKVLAPDTRYQSFTETAEVIPKGTKIKGCPKYIQGMRKGMPFTYRLFLTDDNKLIFLNKAFLKEAQQNNKNMEKTEVTLAADGSKITETLKGYREVVSLSNIKARVGGIAVGAIVGAIYGKYKKMPNNKIMKAAAIGAGVGFIASYLFGNSMTVVAPAERKSYYTGYGAGEQEYYEYDVRDEESSEFRGGRKGGRGFKKAGRGEGRGEMKSVRHESIRAQRRTKPAFDGAPEDESVVKV